MQWPDGIFVWFIILNFNIVLCRFSGYFQNDIWTFSLFFAVHHMEHELDKMSTRCQEEILVFIQGMSFKDFIWTGCLIISVTLNKTLKVYEHKQLATCAFHFSCYGFLYNVFLMTLCIHTWFNCLLDSISIL